MKLLVITPPNDLEQEAETANLLLAYGLEALHVRKPWHREDELCAYLDRIDPAHYHKLALHQHHRIAERYRIRRLHYPEAMREAADLQELEAHRSNHIVLSTSVHAPDTLAGLTGFAYAFYGPVFESISKPGYGTGSKPFTFPERRLRATDVIGIGGVTSENIRELKKMNFDGAALLGSIWQDIPNALSTFKTCLSHIA